MPMQRRVPPSELEVDRGELERRNPPEARHPSSSAATASRRRPSESNASRRANDVLRTRLRHARDRSPEVPGRILGPPERETRPAAFEEEAVSVGAVCEDGRM